MPEPDRPRPAVALAEAVLEQQHEVPVVLAELPVVQRLPVVGVGPRGQQQFGQREPVRVVRLVVLAAAQRAGDRGERRVQPVPQVTGVGVGAVVQ